MMKNKRRLLVAAIASMATVTAALAAEGTAELREVLLKQFPATRVDEIRATPVAGVYEVSMGKNLAYVDTSGRYFMFGHLYDMVGQKDLTELRKPQLDRIDFTKLPFEDAIKIVHGNGQRKIAVFSDPDCPYCRKLEGELAKLTDTTVYVFSAPYPSLHPEALDKSIAIWCSADRAAAWRTFMNGGSLANTSNCSHPIERNMALRDRLGIVGTPTIVTSDGQKRPGAASITELNQWLVAAR